MCFLTRPYPEMRHRVVGSVPRLCRGADPTGRGVWQGNGHEEDFALGCPCVRGEEYKEV